MKKYIPFIPLILGIFLFILFIFYDSSNLPKIQCGSKLIFKIPCIACGGTRSFISFMKLNFYKAIQYNLVLTILYIYVIFIYFRFLYQYIRKIKITSVKILPITIIFIIALFIYNTLRIFFPISIA